MKKFGLKNIVYLGIGNEHPVFRQEYGGTVFGENYGSKRVKKIELTISKYLEK